MNEQELQQALAMLDMYKAQLETMQKQFQLLQASLDDLNRAKETMERFAQARVGDDMLMPVGANSFVYAKVAINDKALVGVGSRVAVEKTMDDAVATMVNGIAEVQEALTNLEKGRIEIETQAAKLSSMVQQAYQQMQGP